MHIALAKCHWTSVIIGPSSDICWRSFTSSIIGLSLNCYLQRTFKLSPPALQSTVDCQQTSTRSSIADELLFKQRQNSYHLLIIYGSPPRFYYRRIFSNYPRIQATIDLLLSWVVY
ncbi:hypothetical protein KFK09_005618 [Dendrobium nobile]|uniref:Uncharacterized protein n=1 Tax=Dendrobium nobile TaxID=94219 RepID=A0A8T3BW96_DENNO|nr:hypothetical protein KFK09_005618 [Dendrobium nobile]